VKIILYLFTGIVILLALMTVIGALLPRDHTATRSAVFRQSPAMLYAVAADFAAQPSWYSGASVVEMLPPRDGLVCYRATSKHGAITFLVLENDPGKKLVTKIADESLPFGGTWTYEFLPAPEGGCVRITEQGEVKNVLFRFLGRFVFGYNATLDTYLRDLGKKFDEDVTPQP
jgi:Polyketide cyclase / dehydrase and lipid transport